jgi:ketosteroid isomerase-like protein
MSQENVEVIRRLQDAFNRGDAEAFLSQFAPDVEYESSGIIPGVSGVMRGRAEYRRVFLEGLWGEFEHVHAQIDEIEGHEDKVACSVTVRARGKQSGAETSWSFTQLWTLRDGQIVRGQGFEERAEALAAAGMRT